MTYLRIRSVHVLVTFTRDGGAITRCGRRVRPPLDGLLSDTLELHDRSCETCLRLTLRDQEASVVENDPVGNEPPVEDDPVPE